MTPSLQDARTAPACRCDRPMPMHDEDLGVICGRCGHATTATSAPPARTPRAPQSLVAVVRGAAGNGDRSQEWIVPGAPRASESALEPVTLSDRVVALVEELGEATSVELAPRLNLSAKRAGTLLADAARGDRARLVRVGTRPSTAGGRPVVVYGIHPSHAPKGSDEAEQPAAHEPRPADEQSAADADESPAGTAAADDDRTGEHEGTPSEDAAADGREAAAPDPDPKPEVEAESEPEQVPEVTDDQAVDDEDLALAWRQLQVLYVRGLIDLITRSSVLRSEAPPVHVFDRCERLLGLATTSTTSSDEPEEARTA